MFGVFVKDCVCDEDFFQLGIVNCWEFSGTSLHNLKGKHNTTDSKNTEKTM